MVERKHHRLARSERSRISDRDAKPTARLVSIINSKKSTNLIPLILIKFFSSIRDQLHTIVYRYPPTCVLNSEEQDLLWKFRFYLCSHKKALTKFLKCINWETPAEVQQALILLSKWAPMDVEDALELLSPAFKHPQVRKYAISRLAQAPDEDLLLYLLQLVQALKYENFTDIMESHKRVFPDRDIVRSLDDNSTLFDQSSLCSELSAGGVIAGGAVGVSSTSSILTANQRNSNNLQRTNVLIDRSSAMPIAISVNSSLADENETSIGSLTSDVSNTLMSDTNTNVQYSTMANSATNLATFLIQRACKNPTLANYLYWYLSIEVEDLESIRKQDESVHEMYDMVLKMFMKILENGDFHLRGKYHNLKKQQRFIDELVKLVKIVAKEPGNRNKKTEKFQKLLSETDTFKINFTNIDPIPFPLDPDISITRIVPSKTSLFKSALMPAK